MPKPNRSIFADPLIRDEVTIHRMEPAFAKNSLFVVTYPGKENMHDLGERKLWPWREFKKYTVGALYGAQSDPFPWNHYDIYAWGNSALQKDWFSVRYLDS